MSSAFTGGLCPKHALIATVHFMSNNFSKVALLRSYVGLSSLYLLGIPLLLIMNIVLARTLSVADFGLFGFALSLATVLSIPVSGGLPMLLTREVAGYAQRENWPAYRGLVLEAYRWVFLVSVGIGLAFLTWHAIFGAIVAQQLLITFLLIPFFGLNAIQNGILKGLGRPLLAEAPSQALQPTLLILGYLILAKLSLASATNALWWYFIVIVIVFGLASIMLWRVHPPAVRAASCDVADQPRWRRALLPFMMMSATAMLSTQVAVLISGFMGQEEVVAYLRVAERGTIITIIPFHVLSSIIGPHMVAAIQTTDIGQQRDIVCRSSRLMFFTSLPVAIAMLLFGEQVLSLSFGPSYGDKSYLPMIIVSLAQVISLAFGNNGMLLSMGGHERLILASQALALCINIGLCILLIGPFGAVGASIGVSAGVIASTVMNVFLVKRHYGFIPGILLRQSYQ